MAQRPPEDAEACRLKLKFKEKSELSRIFDDWDGSVQSFLLNRATMENGELPIVAFYEAETHWFLVTTRRLICMNPGELPYALRHNNVQSVGWSSGPNGLLNCVPEDNPDSWVLTDNGKGHCSHYSPWLHIIDCSGKRYEALLEKGNIIGMRNTIWQLSEGWLNASEQARKENEAAQVTLPPTGSDLYRARKLRISIEKWLNPKSLIPGPEQVPHLRLFEDADQTVQDFFKRQANLPNSEIPIVVYDSNDTTSLLITSRRLLWWSKTENQALDFSEIESCGMSYGPAGAAIDWVHPAMTIRRDTTGSPVWLTKVADACSPWIFIESRKGKRYEIKLIQNKFGVLDCLRPLIRMEKRLQERQSEKVQSDPVTSPVSRMKNSLKSFFYRFKSDPPAYRIELAYQEIEKEWLDLWQGLTHRMSYLSSGRPEVFQEFTMWSGGAFEFRTPDFVGSSEDKIRTEISQLEQTMNDYCAQSVKLARIRKLLLWTVHLFEPKVLKEITQEYLIVVEAMLQLFRPCRIRGTAPEVEKLARLSEDCAALEQILIMVIENSIHTYSASRNAPTRLEVFTALELFLQHRIADARDEADKLQKNIDVAENEVELDCVQYLKQQQENWEKTVDSAARIRSIVKAKIADSSD